MAGTEGVQLAAEVALWAVPGLLALRAARGSSPSTGRTWWLVAGCCAVISLDKALDLHALAMKGAHWLASVVDPELRNQGARQGLRTGLLLGGALVGTAGLWLLARRGGRPDGAQYLSLAGLALVLLLLATRLTARGRVLVEDPRLAWAVELTAWGLVLAGTLRARRAQA